MPQLNPEFYFSQLFWLIVSFSFLLIFLWKISLPRISAVLEKRENKINNDIETAKQLQNDAEEIQKDIDQKLKEANEKTSDLIKESSLKIQKFSMQKISELESELSKEIDKSYEEISIIKKQSLSSVNDQIFDIVKLLLPKLSSIKVENNEINSSIQNAREGKFN